MVSKHFTSAASNLFASFANKRFEPAMQTAINKLYIKLMGLDMTEFRSPESYKTLNELFTRQLKMSRKLPNDSKAIISPVDAKITQTGVIQDNLAYQIKGMSYDIRELFGQNHQVAAAQVDKGEFINFYLSPKDYHRYHSPMDLQIISLTHIPGKLYPVNIPLLKHKKNLFIENERVIIEAKDNNDKIHVLVLVGALNVGKMIVDFEPGVKTNSSETQPTHYKYEDVKLKRGELFGYFEMGSTVLLFSEKNSIKPQVRVNESVKYTQEIAQQI